MKLNFSKIERSNRDLSRKIRVPKKLTLELAHLMGIQLGDGSMVFNEKNYDYWVGYSGHLTEEFGWYMDYLAQLLNGLFNICVSIQEDRRPKRSMIRLYFRSKAILTFLHGVLGLPLGDKKGHGIPQIIKNSNLKIKQNFLKGLADTEFSIRFSNKTKDGKHKYPVISYGAASTLLAKEVNNLLKEFGFKTYSKFNISIKLNNKYFTTNIIYLNGKGNLKKWFKLIGFTSPKHLTKYKVWKRYGFCPPKTTLKQREQILKGKLNIWSV